MSATPSPHPSLSPEQVVRIQLEALRSNGPDDAGIRLAFQFASPANQEVTGPVERFIGLVKNPVYRPMIGFREARLGPVLVEGATARLRATLIDAKGKTVVFEFILSKQQDEPYDGCWMTDGVVREEEPSDFLRIRPEQLN